MGVAEPRKHSYAIDMNPPSMANEPAGPDQSRLLLAVVLSTALIFVWNVLFPPDIPPPQPEADVAAATTDGGKATAETEPAAVPSQAMNPADDAQLTAQAAPEQKHSVAKAVEGASATVSKGVRGGLEAELTSIGGQISSWRLPGYGDTSRAVMNEETGEQTMPKMDLAITEVGAGIKQYALQSVGGDVNLAANAGYSLQAKTADGATFSHLTSSGVKVSRTYTFEDGRFGFNHDLVLENTSGTPRTAHFDIIVAAVSPADEKEKGFFASMGSRDPLTAGCSLNGDRETFDVSDLSDDEDVNELKGTIEHAAASLQYFTAAVLPKDPASTTGCTAKGFWHQPVNVEDKGQTKGAVVNIHLAPITLAPGETKTVSQRTFFGPNQLQLLQAEGANLGENIDFGIFGVISRPILAVLVFLNDFTGNFGLAIILLTILIKLLTFPLTQKSYTSMQQMKTFQPLMKELQAKYGHDRTLLGQKQMEMYKEKGINPLAGCFPMLIQMPIWFALYRTLWNSVELYQQPFYGWITDLSQPDLFPLIGFALLPFGVGALMLLQTTMSPPPQDQPQMKYVLWAMPIMFTFMMFQMPSGLSVYMITNSTLTFAQQWFIKRKFDNVDPNAPTTAGAGDTVTTTSTSPSAKIAADAAGKPKKKKKKAR